MRALIVVDMLNDFVDGKLANPKAQAIIGPLQRLLAHARGGGWVVVFSNDAQAQITTVDELAPATAAAHI